MLNRLRPWSRPESSDTREDEAPAAGRNDGRRHVRDPDVGGRPQLFDLGIPTVSDPGVYDPTTIVVEMSSASISAMASQSRTAKHAWMRSYGLACRVFEPPRLRLQLIEAGERGVEVCLVE